MKSYSPSSKRFFLQIYKWNVLLSMITGATFAQGLIQVIEYGHRLAGFILMFLPSVIFILELVSIRVYWNEVRENWIRNLKGNPNERK